MGIMEKKMETTMRFLLGMFTASLAGETASALAQGGRRQLGSRLDLGLEELKP